MVEGLTDVFLNIVGNKLLISFDGCDITKARIKKISGSRFNKQYYRWETPLSSYDQVLSLPNKVVISNGIIERIQKENKLNKEIEDLKNADYYEIMDYTPKTGLYPHQKKAFHLHRLANGSANFSEVGAGKTASTICAIHYRRLLGDIERCLVVCPLSIIEGWQEQLKMFSDLTFTALVGSKEKRIKRLNEDYDVYLINYDYLRHIKDELLERGFDFVVLDECHRVKNPTAKQSKAAYELGDAARYRIALTGSPILNSPIDAFGIMRFIDPSVFGDSYYSFRNKFFKNVSNNSAFPILAPRQGAEKYISDKLYSRAIRYLKEECMDLPEAIFMPNRIVPLSPEQDRAYKQMQEDLMVELGEKKKVKLTHVLAMMMKLNQITSGWLKLPTGEIHHFPNNPKFKELKVIMEDEVCGKPVILWAYYKADMDLLYNYYSRCQKCKEPTNDVIGNTCSCGNPIKHRVSQVRGGIKQREFQIARFRLDVKERAKLRSKMIEDGASKKEIKEMLGELIDGKHEPPQTDIFIGQISAASEGLNLQRATISIYYSRDYSLKNHIQSLGRNHRGGQKNTVVYYNIVCSRQSGDNTVDMRILESLTRKENLSQRINKDDLKFVLPNFRKKDREALKNIEFEEPEEGEDIEITDIDSIVNSDDEKMDPLDTPASPIDDSQPDAMLPSDPTPPDKEDDDDNDDTSSGDDQIQSGLF